MMALLQPSPEVFQLFDDVMLLSDGMCVYFGPREGILPFFESQGFRCPPRMPVPGFLQNITSRRDQQVDSRHQRIHGKWLASLVNTIVTVMRGKLCIRQIQGYEQGKAALMLRQSILL